LFVLSAVHAQKIIKGKITDEHGNAVIGANIYLVDTYDGTSSDFEGNYLFKTSETGSQVLIATFIGYAKAEFEVELKGKDTLVYNLELTEAIDKLNAVVISAGSFSAGEENNREVLETLDIVTTAGATADVAGALNTLPGTQTVGEHGRLFVRGGDGYETRTFIDGLEVLDSYAPSAPQTPTRGRFSPFMFDGTSFSTGGYSAEYGQALSSALILNTKDVAVQDRTDISLMSVGADIAHSQSFKKSSVSAKVQYTNLTPYFEMVSQRINYEQAPVSYESNFAYRHKTKKGMFKLYGNLNHTSLHIYRPQILESSQEDEIDISNTYSYLNANYSGIINEKWSHSSGVSFTNSLEDLRVDEMRLNDDLKGIHTKTVFFYDPTDKFSLKSGIENFTHSSQFVISEDNVKLDYSRSLSAAFAEADYYLSNDLVLRAGLRFELDDLEKQPYLAPRLSLAQKVGENGQVAMAVGKFNQSPQHQYLRVARTLKSERADHYILNYQINKSGRTFRIEGYYKDYNQLVKFDDPFDAQTFSNTGNGYATGLDLFWRDNKSIKNLDYWVSYSLLDTERDYQDFPETSKPGFSSKHNFSIVTKYFVTDIKTQLGLTYSFASTRPYNNPNKSAFNAERTPAYHDLSINLSYLYRSNIIVHASLTNVLGIDNIFGYEWSNERNSEGEFVGRAITLPAPRFFFLGVFITLSKNKSVNQLPNL